MTNIKQLRYFGVLTVAILWSFIGLGMARAGLLFSDTRPLSYLGTDGNSNFLFSSALILAAVTTIAFGYYLTRVFNASRAFFIVLIVGQICQIVAALVPFSKVSSTRLIHTFAAFGLALATPLFIYLFARSQTGKYKKVSLYFAYMSITLFVIGIGGFTTIRSYAPLFQFLVAVTFHGWLVYFTFANPDPVTKKL